MYYREQQPDTSESSIKIMDLATKKVTTLVGKSMSKQNTILASPDGRWLATNDELGVGYLWDVKKLMPNEVELQTP